MEEEQNENALVSLPEKQLVQKAKVKVFLTYYFQENKILCPEFHQNLKIRTHAQPIKHIYFNIKQIFF